MNLIEVYDDGATLTIEGRTFPVSCLVEDDDAIRIVVVESIHSVPMRVWQKAHSSGARHIVAPSQSGGWVSISMEEFLEARREHKESWSYLIPDNVKGMSTSEFPTYRVRWEYQEAKGSEPMSGEFVHLHCHSEFSALDGLTTVQEMVDRVVEMDQSAVAITDHGVCAAHPHLQAVTEKAGIKPIFGIEANLTDNRHLRGDPAVKGNAREVLSDYRHLIMWAETNQGLLNLWAMSTEANREGFYGRPRMDWDTLDRHSEGVMVSTACLRGPVARHILNGDEERARTDLGRLMGIFGTDRVYVELQTNQLPEQRKVNEALVGLAQEYGLPLLAAVDSHYAHQDDSKAHRIWIASQTNRELQDEAELFVGDEDYYLMDATEVRQRLFYLPPRVVDEAIGNTLAVAERCKASISGKAAAPVFSKMGSEDDSRQRDIERLVDLCLSNWSKKCEGNSNPVEVYEARFEREMRLLIDKGFCGYYLMVSDYTRWSRAHGILVGPGRGSGSGSLVAYLADITEIDPIEADLMFERFLTEGRNTLPDFDVDFPTSKRDELTRYIIDKYGEENVVRVGTHIRLKNKGVIRDMARVLKKEIPNLHYPDIDAISKIIDEAEADKAGLGMPWEDLWDEHEEVLEPYRLKYPMLFEAAEKLEGRLKTYGKHAAGMVIAPDADLTERLPLRLAGDDIVAEFDMDSLEEMGLVKFDLLTLRTLDTIQQTVDLVKEQTGDQINVYDWTDEYDDELMWDQIGEGHTLGIFQIETPLGTRETKRLSPRSVDDLADVITLVRPGPKRSGLTELYFRRRKGNEEVTFLDDRLVPILEKTYGCMIYQEQVMNICMVLGGYDSTEADVVRKILGKKQIEKVEEEGRRFKARCVENGTKPEVADVIWTQMAEFAKYSFNKAHAYGYAMLGVWTAWLKFHYPIQFLTAVLSTIDKGRIPTFIQEARRMGVRVLPPDVNKSGSGFSAGDGEVRYGLDSVKGVGKAAVDALTEAQPYVSWDDLLERKGKAANVGILKTLARVGTFDSLYPNRKELELRLEWENDGEADRCHFRDDTVLKPHGLPCTFDWASEPVVIGKSGKPLKSKPLPKRCSKACRNWTAPEFFYEGVPNYTTDEVIDIEMEMLGVHLTATPFDRLPDWLWEPDADPKLVRGSEIDDGPQGAYFTPVIIRRARPHVARTGKSMGFVAMYAVDLELDVTVFSDEWKTYQRDLTTGTFGFAYVYKNQRGLTLSQFQVIDPGRVK